MSGRKTLVGRPSHRPVSDWKTSGNDEGEDNSVLKGINFIRPPHSPQNLFDTKMDEAKPIEEFEKEVRAFRMSVENPLKEFGAELFWTIGNSNDYKRICGGEIQYNDDSMTTITISVKDENSKNIYNLIYTTSSNMEMYEENCSIRIKNISHNIPKVPIEADLLFIFKQRIEYSQFGEKLKVLKRITDDENYQTSEGSLLKSSVVDPEGYGYDFNNPSKELFLNLKAFAIMAIDNESVINRFAWLLLRNKNVFKCIYTAYTNLIRNKVELSQFTNNQHFSDSIKWEQEQFDKDVETKQLGPKQTEERQQEMYNRIRANGVECRNYIEAYLDWKEQVQTILDFFRACFSITNDAVYDYLLKEDTIDLIFEMYGNDPNLTKPIDFLSESSRVQVRQIVPYPGDIVKQLKFIVKLNYFRDVVVARFLDESASRYFTWFINNKRLAIVKKIQMNQYLIDSIANKFKTGNVEDRKGVVSFYSSILKIYSGSLSNTAENTKLSFDEIKRLYIFKITIEAYRDDNYDIRSRAVDLLNDMIEMDSFGCARAIYTSLVGQKEEIPIVVICQQFISETHRSLIMNMSHQITYLLEFDSFNFTVEEKRTNSSLIYGKIVPLLCEPLDLLPRQVEPNLREFMEKVGHCNFDCLITEVFEIIGCLFKFHAEYCQLYFETGCSFLQVLKTWINCKNDVLETAIIHCVKKMVEKISGVAEHLIVRSGIIETIIDKYLSKKHHGITLSLLASIMVLLAKENGNEQIIEHAVEYLSSTPIEKSLNEGKLNETHYREIKKSFENYLDKHLPGRMSTTNISFTPRYSFIKKFSAVAQKRKMSEISDEEIGGKRKTEMSPISLDSPNDPKQGTALQFDMPFKKWQLKPQTDTNPSNAFSLFSNLTSLPPSKRTSDDTPVSSLKYIVYPRKSSFS